MYVYVHERLCWVNCLLKYAYSFFTRAVYMYKMKRLHTRYMHLNAAGIIIVYTYTRRFSKRRLNLKVGCLNFVIYDYG